MIAVYFLALILNFWGIPFPISSANIHHVLVQVQYSKQVHWTPLIGASALQFGKAESPISSLTFYTDTLFIQQQASSPSNEIPPDTSTPRATLFTKAGSKGAATPQTNHRCTDSLFIQRLRNTSPAFAWPVTACTGFSSHHSPIP